MDDGDRQLDAHLQAFERPPYDLTVGPGRESDNRQFGELLERLRWKAGISRADAAAKLGFSSEYLRLIEVGKRTPALGQVPKFLDAYGADGEIEGVQPGGERPDLIVIDPLNDEPVVVEFISRIREARRIALDGPPDEVDGQVDPGQPKRRPHDRPSAIRAVELGMVVSLLTQADDSTLRKIREILEGEIDHPGRASSR
ncbi:helix-turn-helix domain-containing protein [Micromonospora chalcea]|uniref:helix-turn-helix domain-containing protein n=1 Tax=Micromonospora chalcea TaxID=1874 RepID=UPI000A05B76D|nr:helix-turn-helix transcriptional regulator [Micromonospora purpureochromogenes]